MNIPAAPRLEIHVSDDFRASDGDMWGLEKQRPPSQLHPLNSYNTVVPD